MKSQDVIYQLMAKLPSLTDLFTDKFALASITSSGLLATAVSAAPHGLITGANVTIIGARSPIAIQSFSRTGIVGTILTQTDHDLTLGYKTTVETSGAVEAQFNGTFEITNILNRRSIVVKMADSGPLTSTGTRYVHDAETYGYNGFKVVTVVNPTTFTYAIPKALPLPASGTPFACGGYRITGSVSIDRYLASYTKLANAKLSACVVLGDTLASKDRNVAVDSSYHAGTGQAYIQKLVQPFSVYVIAPCVDEIAARKTRDDMEDVFPFITKSLVGVRFGTYLAANKEFMTTFVSHGILQYNNGAYYVHEYNFESLAQLTVKDTVGEDFNVAFRDIDLTMNVSTGSEQLTSDINLDESP